MPSQSTLSVTRVINPCALICVDDATVLTDPYFRSQRLLPRKEPIGGRVDRLPPLAAVLGGHGAFDHWQMAPLRGACPADLPVLVPHRRMHDRAAAMGFSNVHEVHDGDDFAITNTVRVRTVAGDRVMRRPTNHYLVAGDCGTIYVGTEACSLEPMRRVGGSVPVDAAVLPIDGLTFAGRQLVMNAATAIDAALILGARVLVPFHYSQRPVPPLIRCRSGLEELLILAAGRIEVRHAATGVPIDLA